MWSKQQKHKMLAALSRNATRAVLKAPASAARRHGSGGGGVPTKPPFAGIQDGMNQSIWNKIVLQRKGSNPLGEDVVGLEGSLGKYCAFMVGVNAMMWCIPEKH